MNWVLRKTTPTVTKTPLCSDSIYPDGHYTEGRFSCFIKSLRTWWVTLFITLRYDSFWKSLFTNVIGNCVSEVMLYVLPTSRSSINIQLDWELKLPSRLFCVLGTSLNKISFSIYVKRNSSLRWYFVLCNFSLFEEWLQKYTQTCLSNTAVSKRLLGSVP